MEDHEEKEMFLRRKGYESQKFGKKERLRRRRFEKSNVWERQITSLNLSVEYQSSKQVNERIFTILKKNKVEKRIN